MKSPRYFNMSDVIQRTATNAQCNFASLLPHVRCRSLEPTAFPVYVSTRPRLITIHLRKHVACARDNTYECNFLGQRRCRRLRLHRCCRRYREVTLVPEDCLYGETKTRRYRVPQENRREAEVSTCI